MGAWGNKYTMTRMIHDTRRPPDDFPLTHPFIHPFMGDKIQAGSAVRVDHPGRGP